MRRAHSKGRRGGSDADGGRLTTNIPPSTHSFSPQSASTTPPKRSHVPTAPTAVQIHSASGWTTRRPLALAPVNTDVPAPHATL